MEPVFGKTYRTLLSPTTRRVNDHPPASPHFQACGREAGMERPMDVAHLWPESPPENSRGAGGGGGAAGSLSLDLSGCSVVGGGRPSAQGGFSRERGGGRRRGEWREVGRCCHLLGL